MGGRSYSVIGSGGRYFLVKNIKPIYELLAHICFTKKYELLTHIFFTKKYELLPHIFFTKKYMVVYAQCLSSSL